MEEARNLSTLLDLFVDFSGLQLNRAKSTLVGFGLTHEEGLQCSKALETSIGSLPMRYLSLPVKKGRTSRTDWDPIIEKVERRLEGWQAKLLSRAGQLVLLRSVFAAIPIFQLSLYKLSIEVGKRLEGLMRRFLWKGSGFDQCRGQALVSWDNVCRPIQAGGLEILDIHKMNTALLEKWIARFMNSREDLGAQVVKES